MMTHKRRLSTLIPLAVLLTAPAAIMGQSPPSDSPLQKLEREMARVSKIAGGVVGASALHLETGRRASLNGSERFPMASTFKIPIAVQLLSRVERGEMSLAQMVTLQPGDLHPGSGTLTDLFNKPGVALSVHNLLELMLLISDNSATDVLLRLAGGPEAVTGRMRELGIEGINVNRPTSRLIADWIGVASLPAEEEWSPELFRKLLAAVPEEERKAAAKKFDADPRDTAAPEAMAALLARIYRGEALKKESTDLLLDIMRRCRTGETRLKGILPAGAVVAHKTGSIGGTTNDVGILELPEGGHVALAVFVKSSDKEAPARERAIAEIARSVYDFFLFQPGAAAAALNYDAMAARITAALRLEKGERTMLRYDPAYFRGLVEPLTRRIREAGAVDAFKLDATPPDFEQKLGATDVYFWLPLRDERGQLSAADRAALARWLDKGGRRREIHFHWSGGSVRADGLAGEHSAALDAIYQDALDIDYKALRAAQDRAIAKLRRGMVRVRTPEGTDLQFRIGARPFNVQDGDASPERVQKARVRVDREIELPAGVLRVAPLEETANGRIVIPEARFGNALARNIKLTIQRGRVTKVEADENLNAVEQALSAGGEAARRFREFGLGFNPKLRAPAGSPILAYYGYGAGVVRLSLGDNTELGGLVSGGFVRWFFFPQATVEVNGRALVREGKMVE
ncbi:MAG: class A beta-lactamase [Acidobacteria bacterium]|nr:class A beta-lactamase [Acidobacteriota bacterium]